MTPCYDVAIAGAGPAGAATACRLARAGLRVIVADRAEFPRDKICSEYMSPEGVRHLAALGVLEAVERRGGHPIRGTTVHAPRGSSLTGIFARAGHAPFRDTGLSVARRLLDQALVDAARRAGADLLERTAVQAVLRDGAAVTGLLVRDAAGKPRELRARLTIGADGLRSLVALALGPRRSGPLRRYAMVAHVGEVAGLGDIAEMHVTPRGYVGLNPLGGGIANVALVLPHERMRPARGRVRQFFFEELARFAGVGPRICSRNLLREVLVTGPFAVRAAAVTAPGALLVGDAADFFDPATGDGIYCALRGAELVADTAVAALSLPGPITVDRLIEYRQGRRRLFAGKWMLERMIDSALRFPRLFDRGVSRLGQHEGMAHRVIGLAGGFVPMRAVLNPVFLARMIL